MNRWLHNPVKQKKGVQRMNAQKNYSYGWSQFFSREVVAVLGVLVVVLVMAAYNFQSAPRSDVHVLFDSLPRISCEHLQETYLTEEFRQDMARRGFIPRGTWSAPCVNGDESSGAVELPTWKIGGSLDDTYTWSP